MKIVRSIITGIALMSVVCNARILFSAIKSAHHNHQAHNSSEAHPTRSKIFVTSDKADNSLSKNILNIHNALEAGINATDCTAILFLLSASPPEHSDQSFALHLMVGRLAERSTSIRDRSHLLDAAWALSQLGHTHLPLLRELRDSTLGSANLLSDDTVFRLIIIFQRAAISEHTQSTMALDLALGNAYLLQLARLAESKLSSITDTLTLTRVLEAVRVVLYPNPVTQFSDDPRSLAESSFPSRSGFQAGETTPPAKSCAETQSLTEDGFNTYSHNEIEGIYRDSDRLAALVAAAAKGKTEPVEPGIVISAVKLALLPLGAAVRMQFALQYLPPHTVSASSIRSIDAEIIARWDRYYTFDARRDDRDLLDSDETAMLAKMWLTGASSSNRDRAIKALLQRSQGVVPTDRSDAGALLRATHTALMRCTELIDALRMLTASGHYNEQIVEASLRLINFQISSSDGSTAPFALSSVDKELQFQVGVLHEVLISHKKLIQRLL